MESLNLRTSDTSEDNQNSQKVTTLFARIYGIFTNCPRVFKVFVKKCPFFKFCVSSHCFLKSSCVSKRGNSSGMRGLAPHVLLNSRSKDSPRIEIAWG